MADLFKRIVLRVLLCSAASYLVWRQLGSTALPICAPLLGVMLARPIIDVFSASRATLRRFAHADVEGRHFAYRGIALDIVEDDRHHRWISLADLRKVLPTFPRDAALLRQCPRDIRSDPALRCPRIEADALLGLLANATEPNTLRFKTWLRREVVLPAATIRRRLGIRDEGPDAAEH